MRIHVKTKNMDEPADLVWGEYRNGGPRPEPALRLFSPSGELLTTATRSLSAYNMFPPIGHMIVHTNGANEGLIECLLSEGVVAPPLVMVPIGEELFVVCAISEKSRGELALALMPASGRVN